MEAQLIACVQRSMDQFLYNNAKFMCERLYAEFATEANLILLATVYIKADQAYRSYHILKGAQRVCQQRLSAQARYLLAQCCYKLGKYDEAKSALKEDSRGEVPGGAAGFYLLGQLYSLTDNPSRATASYQAALVRDPTLWCAYEGLCHLGHNEDAQEVLRRAEFQAQETSQQNELSSHLGHDNLLSYSQTPAQELQGARMSFDPSTGLSSSSNANLNSNPRMSSGHAASHLSALPSQELFPHEENTPSGMVSGSFVTPSPGVAPLQVAAPPRRNLQPGLRETPTPTPMHRAGGRRGSELESHPWKINDGGKVRKVSNRLFAEPSSAIRDSPNVTTRRGSRLANHSTPLNTLPPNDASKPSIAAPQFPSRESYSPKEGARIQQQGETSAEGMRDVISLLRLIGRGYGLLCMYKCREAIEAFEALSVRHYKTAWVLCQMGKAHYELVDFAQAASAFRRARGYDPTRLDGMELYSTVLWHLKKEVELSHLAQEAIALDRLDPRSWCIMGNCFSLQKDQNAALRFFQRALQLDPTFTYAYTLAGHENLALEQFEKSLMCYRNAMRLDPRHYNAWYGVGQIFYRQEKYEVAAYHFEGSLKINECSSVLLCYMGMALAKLNRLQEATQVLRRAICTDPGNPLARFELASVAVSRNCLDEALAELEVLKDKAPREASIYFQMGRIYKRLNHTDKALMYFSQALDLRPSSADVNMIKSAIEKLKVSSEFEENNDM